MGFSMSRKLFQHDTIAEAVDLCDADVSIKGVI